MFYQLLREIGQGFDWLGDFLSEWNKIVYCRARRSRPSMGSAAFGHPVRQKIFQAIKD